MKVIIIVIMYVCSIQRDTLKRTCIKVLPDVVMYTWEVVTLNGRPQSVIPEAIGREVLSRDNMIHWGDLANISSICTPQIQWCIQNGNTLGETVLH